MAFTRQLHALVQNEIKNQSSPLMRKLCNDPSVFPSIRDGRVDFYHRGGKLFSFDGNFSTHIKYASVLDCRKIYVGEKDLSIVPHLTDFASAEMYPRIKENCALYAGEEAFGVFSICERFSWHHIARQVASAIEAGPMPVIVLDVEISLKRDTLGDDGGPKQRTHDRIDVLLFNTVTATLGFVEAKLFSNPEIWADTKHTPPIAKQLVGYREQIEEKYDRILAQYKAYVQLANHCFGTSLPEPTRIESDVSLLIFGFDAAQRDSRLKNHLNAHAAFNSISSYAIGDIRAINLKTLWNKVFPSQ